MKKAKAPRAIFNQALLSRAYCQDADFSDGQFRGADLMLAHLENAQLGRADLRWKDFLRGQTFRTDKMFGGIRWTE